MFTMRIFQGPLFLQTLVKQSILGLLLIAFATNVSLAQSANHKPNLNPTEFTEKGINIGWMEGQQIPDFHVNDVFNKKFKLYELLDKPLVIEFFALNNDQSKKNKKYLKAFYNQYNINILGVCADEYTFQIQDINKNYDLPWSIVQDNSKVLEGKTFAQKYGLENVKFLIILPGGIVHKVMISENEIGKVGVELQKYFNN